MKSEIFENALRRLTQELSDSQQARASLSMNMTQEQRKDDLTFRVAREFLERKQVDKACRFWMQTGGWPKMERVEDLVGHFWDRIFEAHHFGSWIYENGFLPPSTMTEDDLLEFLLVQHWAEIGIQRKKAQLFDWP